MPIALQTQLANLKNKRGLAIHISIFLRFRPRGAGFVAVAGDTSLLKKQFSLRIRWRGSKS